jgi:hypothetical protein
VTNRLIQPGLREYPQTWLLVEAVDGTPRLLGHEVVDLSPGAIELRSVARELRRVAENPERWLALGEQSVMDRLAGAHHRALSFGPRVSYCVEHDARRCIHGGKPFRHLRVRNANRVLTPATSAEIGLYFYGRRPAVFAFVRADTVHGFIGLEWEGLSSTDVNWLSEREMKGGLAE